MITPSTGMPWKTIGFWCAIIMAVSQTMSALRAFGDPLAFAEYMGLPLGESGETGFVTVYALRTTLIAILAAFLALTGQLRVLAVMATIALLLPVGDAVLTAQSGAPDSIVFRHVGIAIFLGFTALMLFRDSRRVDSA